MFVQQSTDEQSPGFWVVLSFDPYVLLGVRNLEGKKAKRMCGRITTPTWLLWYGHPVHTDCLHGSLRIMKALAWRPLVTPLTVPILLVPKGSYKFASLFVLTLTSHSASYRCTLTLMHLLMILLCLFVRFEWSTLKYPTKYWVWSGEREGAWGEGEREGTSPWFWQNCYLIPPPLSHCDSFV